MIKYLKDHFMPIKKIFWEHIQKSYFYYYVIPSIVLIIFILVIIFTSPTQMYNEISLWQNKISTLKKDTVLTVSFERAYAQRQNILSVLQNRESIGGSQYSSHENELTQSRTIYFGILAVLMSIIFSKDLNNKTSIIVILLGLIIIMYLLDVHTEDLMKRELDANYLTISEVHYLLNRQPCDSTWYSISTYDFAIQLGKASIRPDRWVRKIIQAFNPSGVQFVYYFVPFILFYLFLVRKINK